MLVYFVEKYCVVVIVLVIGVFDGGGMVWVLGWFKKFLVVDYCSCKNINGK